MTAINTWDEPFLPWVESQNDRRFRRILITTLVFFTIFGLIMPFLPVPEIERKELKDVSPRLAQLILEKKVQPPPPPKPKVQEKPKDKTAKKPVEKKTVKKKPEKSATSARQKAERTGLVALSDDLADLRESFDISSLQATPQKKSTDKAEPTIDNSILTSKAGQSSGGINTASLSRSTGGSKLSSRKTTQVNKAIGPTTATTTRSSSGRTAVRSEEEIERIFQKNKGAIFSIYNRALRKDPTLQGKVVLELTISPAGTVSNCRVVSSDLNNPALERKLISRIKLFKFSTRNVSPVTITYPIDFLPS